MDKYKNKGYTGLTNLGNTCFLNACMQALNHTYELNEILLSNESISQSKKSLPEAIIITEWNNLREVMWKQNGVVSPNRFVHFVRQLAAKKGRDLFTGYAQNDLPEFLLFIVECMHNTLSKKVKLHINGNIENNVDKLATCCYNMLQQTYAREYSEIMNLFYGIYVSELSRLDGSMVLSVSPEPFFLLDLEIPNNKTTTIYDCLDAFTQYECLEGENAWFNETTGKKENVKKRITFWSFPSILIVTLKRFHGDGARKLQQSIDCPLDGFDLSKYVSGYNPKSYIYDLYAVCNHSGGTMGGHYTAFVKNATSEWIHFNDTHVERHIPANKIISPKAYCFFYRKRESKP
jgi:ubiquitin C-terminal hydrolase